MFRTYCDPALHLLGRSLLLDGVQADAEGCCLGLPWVQGWCDLGACHSIHPTGPILAHGPYGVQTGEMGPAWVLTWPLYYRF